MNRSEKLPSVIAIPASSSVLTVDTRDSYKFQDGYIAPNYTNPYDINIYKNESIFQGRINRIALTEVNMIYSIPNVNPYNNVLFLSNGTTEVAISLKTTFYTPDSLASSLTDVLKTTTSAPGPAVGCFGITSWKVEYNIESASFTISNTSGLPFKINPKYGQNKGTSNVEGESTIYIRTDTLATMMGFGNVPNALCPVGTGNVCKWSSDVASMLYTTYIDVVSRTLTGNQKVRDVSTNDNTGSNLLARIYISKDFQPLDTITQNYTITPGDPPTATNTSFSETNNTYQVRPFYINYQPPYVKQVRWDDSIFLSAVNIRLQDDKGNLLYDFERNPTNSLSGSNAYAQLTFLISESED